MKTQELHRLNKQMTPVQKARTGLELLVAGEKTEGWRLLEELPGERSPEVCGLMTRVVQAMEIASRVGQPAFEAVVRDLTLGLTLLRAGRLGLISLMALDELAAKGDPELDVIVLAIDSDPEEDGLVARAAREAWAFQQAAGHTEPKGIPEIWPDQAPDPSDDLEYLRWSLKSAWERVREDYTRLRTVEIALASLAASVGLSSLVGALSSNFEERTREALCALRLALDEVCTEEQLASLEPTDEQVSELIRNCPN